MERSDGPRQVDSRGRLSDGRADAGVACHATEDGQRRTRKPLEKARDDAAQPQAGRDRRGHPSRSRRDFPGSTSPIILRPTKGPCSSSRPGVGPCPNILQVEVLEALPGRPISGEQRLVRPDGTISPGYYGDIDVAGADDRGGSREKSSRIFAAIWARRYARSACPAAIVNDNAAGPVRNLQEPAVPKPKALPRPTDRPELYDQNGPGMRSRKRPFSPVTQRRNQSKPPSHRNGLRGDPG